MTVRGPPGPPGPSGYGSGDSWLSSAGPEGGGSCGCNETLLRTYVRDVRPKLIPGPPGPQGPPGVSD